MQSQVTIGAKYLLVRVRACVLVEQLLKQPFALSVPKPCCIQTHSSISAGHINILFVRKEWPDPKLGFCCCNREQQRNHRKGLQGGCHAPVWGVPSFLLLFVICASKIEPNATFFYSFVSIVLVNCRCFVPLHNGETTRRCCHHHCWKR